MAIKALERIMPLPLNNPIDLDDGVLTTDIVSLKNYETMLLIIYFADGTAGDDVTVTLQQCTNVANSLSDNKALNCLKTGRIYSKLAADETALRALTGWTEEVQAVADEVWTDDETGEACGFYALEIKASDLDVANGFDCVYATVDGDGGAAKLGCVFAILMDPKYPSDPILMKDPLVD